MGDYKLTREEMETVILGNAASQEWQISTADSRIIRKLAKQGYQPGGRENPSGYASFTIPYDRLRFLKAEKRRTGFALRAKLGLREDTAVQFPEVKLRRE